MAEFRFAVAETGFDKLFDFLLAKLPATAKRASFTPSSQNIYTIYMQCLLKLWDSPKILQFLDTNSVK